ncbi:short-chain dehydrogenase [Amycolatopsis deserti]|uniref:Short-chain dehydrogenase n=1 Tax=Amycolatopsis deserti TaxID=185696 RepID=A0ABQ3I9P6_9PSEU|nr:SDR family oxidoreductase [Amycolatopsis deserti]GHE75649.1 short-chain dehydrogenase [Amycolatopsis deserti]
MGNADAARLDGRVALVTGGASGIGQATARRLSRDGATVVIADIHGEGAEAVAEDIQNAGGRAEAVPCDQTDPDQVAALFDRLDRYDRLDICVANAGWGRFGPFLEIPEKTWRRTFDINVTGTFLVCQAAARRMADLGDGGAVVVTSSSGAVEPVALFSAYCSAKAALNMMVKIMAYELGQFDIRVNAVMPGVTETAMTGGLLATGARSYNEAESPLGRLAKPEDIASAIAYLVSDDSGYVNGAALLVDGGGSAYNPGWFGTDFRRRGEASWTLRHEQTPVQVAGKA